MKKICILLLENQEIVRKGIKLLINEQSDLNVICEVKNIKTVMEKVRKTAPEIVVMNISKPKAHSLQVIKRIKETHPDIKIIILTEYMNISYAQQFSDAGADGYVLKSSSPSVLINSIRNVSKGKSFLDPTFAKISAADSNNRNGSLKGETAGTLTDREEDIFRLIARGYSYKKIAAQLDISVKTVESHKANAMKKMNINDRVGIVGYAISMGWLDGS